MLQLHGMHRDYNSGHFGNESVKAFTGLEIEHTLAYGKQTLFLATNEFDTDQVLELENTDRSPGESSLFYLTAPTTMESGHPEKWCCAWKSGIFMYRLECFCRSVKTRGINFTRALGRTQNRIRSPR